MFDFISVILFSASGGFHALTLLFYFLKTTLFYLNFFPNKLKTIQFFKYTVYFLKFDYHVATMCS